MNYGDLFGIAGGGTMLLGSGGAVAGDLYQDYRNRRYKADEREFSSAQTAQQMAFQERMSNTAHQREFADLSAAGINPILTGTGGSGSSSPSGASASTTALNFPSDPGGRSVSTALAIRRNAAEVDQIKASTRKINRETSLLATTQPAADTKEQGWKYLQEFLDALRSPAGSAKSLFRSGAEMRESLSRPFINSGKAVKEFFSDMQERGWFRGSLFKSK